MRQSSGTTPVSSDFWNISCSSGEISVASSFRILGDMLSGPGALWTYIKHKRKDIVGISSLKMDGKLYCDPVTKSNILNRQFKSAFSEKTSYTTEEFLNIPDRGSLSSGVTTFSMYFQYACLVIF
jgi:hypothetical protein